MLQLERTENTRKQVEKLQEKKKRLEEQLQKKQKSKKADKKVELLKRIRYQQPELFIKNWESMSMVKKQLLLGEFHQLRLE